MIVKYKNYKNPRNQEKHERASIPILKSFIDEFDFYDNYRGDILIPKLPVQAKHFYEPPRHSLYGVGFACYKEFDERILVAISKLVLNYKSIIAVFKYKGSLNVYTVSPLDLNALMQRGDLNGLAIKVCHDEWYINQYIVCGNEWVQFNKI